MKKIPLILRSSSTDLDFADYHLNQDFAAIRYLVREKKYTVGQTETAYRVINHWDQIGVLPDGVGSAKNGWRKFNLIERVWIEVIKRLRNFGLPLETISRVRQSILWQNNEQDSYPDFEYFTVRALISSLDSYVLILSTGEADIGSMDDIELSKVIYGQRDMLLISIKSIFEQIGLNSQKTKNLLNLSDKEIYLLSEINKENVEEIKVGIEDGSVSRVESSHINKHTKDNPLSFQEVRESFKKDKKFGSVLVQFEDGYPKTTKITRKKKFK